MKELAKKCKARIASFFFVYWVIGGCFVLMLGEWAAYGIFYPIIWPLEVSLFATVLWFASIAVLISIFTIVEHFLLKTPTVEKSSCNQKSAGGLVPNSLTRNGINNGSNEADVVNSEKLSGCELKIYKK